MKTSIKAAVRDAIREDARMRKPLTKADLHTGTSLSGATADSFVNFAHKLGVGADNALTSGSYGFNPLTRNRTKLEWIHRGSWLGGQAVDVVADDMTRNGIDFINEIEPDDHSSIERAAGTMGVWEALNECVRWGRLYGGCLAVMLIDGQDPRTPLKLETVGPEQFKGLMILDRWMCDPSLEDLVTDYGPHLGLPKYYKVQDNAPAMRGQAIHHSRIALRHDGIQLPYNQRLTENLWGISVLERLFDRMVAFDSASMGAAQLVFKSHLRTLKIPGFREIVAAGGPIMDGLLAYTEMMRRFQGIEGLTLIDGEDDFDVQQSSAFSGVDSIITQLAMQLSGALQIPLVRLFGQSPGGLNSTGESDLRNYYDHIRQQQRKTMLQGVTTVYKLIAQSESIKLPDGFALDFTSLWDMDGKEKAEIAGKVTETVIKAKDGGLISDQVSLRELRQQSRVTGVFTNITEELIDAADDEVTPPVDEEALAGLMGGAAGEPGGAAAKGKPPGGASKGGEGNQDLPGDGPDKGGKESKRPRVKLEVS